MKLTFHKKGHPPTDQEPLNQIPSIFEAVLALRHHGFGLHAIDFHSTVNEIMSVSLKLDFVPESGKPLYDADGVHAFHTAWLAKPGP